MRRLFPFGCPAVVAALLLFGNGGVAQAASLRITPVGLDIANAARTGTISLTNDAAEPVTLQLRAFRWTQVEGVDRLEPTDAVIVSPPAATVKPHETYTVRVLRTDPLPLAGEESYRLLIDEIPQAAGSGPQPQGVRMVLRTSLPVFFSAAATATAPLTWHARLANGRIELRATNNGRRHVRLADLSLQGLGTPLSFGGGLNGYVLAGQSVTFTAPVPEPTGSLSGTLSVHADTNDGPVDAPASLDAR